MVGALAFALALPAMAQTPRPQIQTTKVEGTDGVYIFRNGNHQAMFIVTPDGVIATDPVAYGRPTGGADYVAEIRKVTSQPIKYLIYSHHHYDHIAGFEKPTMGEVNVYGHAIEGPGSDRGMVFQDYALFPWLTVRENISFGPRQKGLEKARVREITDEYLNMVGLASFADRFPSQLSGGMKQRVAIARVLANEANLLLMDEPFGALDALTREQLQDELLQIWARTQVTVIFVTHSVEEATLLSDRVIVMTAGPGRIEGDNAITLARPRDVSAPDFNDVRRSLTRQLTSHVARKELRAG